MIGGSKAPSASRLDVPAPASARAPWWVFAVFSAFAALHALRLPLFEGPDEPGNLLYLKFLADERRLPQPSTVETRELEVLDRGIVPPLWFIALAPVTAAIGAGDWHTIAATNPYFLRRATAPLAEALAEPTGRLHHRHGRDEASLLGGPAGVQLRLLRLTAIPFALIALYALWRTAAIVAPLVATTAVGQARFAVLATALLAMTPQFQHLSGTLTMDLCLAAFGSLALLEGARWSAAAGPRDARRCAVRAGAWAGLAALVKLNGLVLFPALALVAWVARRRGLPFLAPLCLAALGALVVAGPWYLWGFLETGHPLWAFEYQHISSYHNPPGMEPPPHSFDRWSAFVLLLVLTWIGNFAWTSVWFPLPVVVAAFVLIAGGLGAAIAVWLRASGRGVASAAAVPAVCAAVLAGTWVLPWGERFLGGTAEAVLAFGAVASAALAVVARAIFARRGTGPIDSEDDGPRASDDRSARAALGALVAAALVILVAEVYFNLRFSQPQARHLYPFLPALVVPLAIGLWRLRLLAVAVALQLFLSVFGLVLIERHLRPAGWNADPLYHATDAERPRAPASGDPRLMPRWVEPAADAQFPADRVPRFVFDGPGDGPHELLVAIENPEFDPRPWREQGVLLRSARDLGERLVGGRVILPVPAGMWRSLPPGTRIDAQVLALDGDGRTAAASAVRTFYKAP